MIQASRLDYPFRAQWLALGVVMLVFGCAVGYDEYRKHAELERLEQTRLLAMTRVVAVNLETNLAAINAALGGISELPTAEPAGARLNAHLETVAEAMAAVRTVFVTDAAGVIIAASRSELRGRTESFSYRDYFKAAQAQSDTEVLIVSAPFRTVLGTYTIALARTIVGARGEFAGVVVAILAPDYFDPLLESVRFAPDLVASMHHGDGVVYLLAPHALDAITGTNLARPGSFFLRHKESGQNASVFSGLVLATGQERMIAQRTVQPAALKMDRSLGVSVSRLLSEIYAPWREGAQQRALLFATLVLAAGALLYAFQHRIWRLMQQQAADGQALAHSENTLRTIVETEPECVKVLAPDGRLLQMNRAGLEMIEAESEEAIRDRKMINLIEPKYRAAFQALTERVCQGDSGTLEFEITGLRGTRRWLATNAAPLRGPDGEIMGLLGVTRDITERKRAEQELRESEERLRLSTELARVAVWEYNFVTNRMARSANHDQLYGLEWQTNWDLDTFLNATHPDDRAPANAAILEAVAAGGPEQYQFDFRVVYPDHSIHWLSVTGQVVARDLEMQGTIVRGCLIDITATRRAEETVQRSEALLRAVTNGTTDAVYAKDLQGRYLLFNDSASAMVGMSSNEVLGKDDTALFPAEEALAVMAGDRRVMASGEVQTYEEEVTMAQGRRTYLSTKGPLRGADGKVSGLFGVARDITDRKQAERELRNAGAKMNAIFNALSEGVVVLDLNGVVTEANAAVATMIDHDGESLVDHDQDARSVVVREDESAFPPDEQPDMTVLRTGEAVRNVQLGVRNHQGEIKWLLVNSEPMRDDEGRLQGAVSSFVDITDLRRKEKRLRDFAGRLQRLSAKLIDVQERERATLARELHDEVGQGLTAVLLNLRNIERRLADETAVSQLRGSIEIADTVFNQLHSLSLNLRPPQLDLLGLERTLLGHVRERALAAGLKYRLNLSLGDRGRTKQVDIACFRIVQEALTNVIRHAQAHEVCVDMEQVSDAIRMSIRDDGVGFDVGAALSPTSGRIGLLGMQERVEILNGAFEITSNPGAGTEILATVPLSSDKHAISGH